MTWIITVATGLRICFAELFSVGGAATHEKTCLETSGPTVVSLQEDLSFKWLTALYRGKVDSTRRFATVI